MAAASSSLSSLSLVSNHSNLHTSKSKTINFAYFPSHHNHPKMMKFRITNSPSHYLQKIMTFTTIAAATKQIPASHSHQDNIVSSSQSQTESVLLHLSSPDTLHDWLSQRIVTEDLSAWGTKPGTKNVHNLWLELTHGETTLTDSTPPVRTVQVATVRIRSGSRVLLESHQELSDGSFRTRLRPLSEKMKPGEAVEEAALRAVREELGSAAGVTIVPGSYERRVVEKVSGSYPGLPACCVLHSVEAAVEGLPEGEFCTEEEDEYSGCGEMGAKEKAVSVRGHFWKWVDEEDAALLSS